MSTATAELAARVAIADTMQRYVHACDRGDTAAAKACYHADAYDDHGRVSGTVDEVFAFLAQYSANTRSTYHFLSAPYVVFESDHAANVETYCMYRREATDNDGEVFSYLQGLRYVDRFEERGGKWLVAHRVVVLDWQESLGDQDVPAPPTSWKRGSRDASDPAHAMDRAASAAR